MHESLISVIIGGILGMGGSVLTILYQSRESKKSIAIERKRYRREKSEEFYLELAGLLDSLSVAIQTDGKVFIADKEYFDAKLTELSDVIERNKGVAALYLPLEISNELLHLNSEILQLISDEDTQKIDMLNAERAKDSPTFKVVAHAKKILVMLRNV